MPGQDKPFDPTEFMTEAELAEHNERQRENSKAMAMLSESNRELVRRLEEKQEQAVLQRITVAVAEARADERRKVLEEVKEIENEAASLLIKKAAEALQMRTWKDGDPLDEQLRLLGISLRDGYEKLRDKLRALAAQPEEG